MLSDVLHSACCLAVTCLWASLCPVSLSSLFSYLSLSRPVMSVMFLTNFVLLSLVSLLLGTLLALFSSGLIQNCCWNSSIGIYWYQVEKSIRPYEEPYPN